MDHFSFRIIENEMILLRITPDRSVSNNQNRKLWRIIHEMLAMDHSLKRRVEKDGFHFRYRKRDQVGFDVVARCEEGKRSVEFYMFVPAVYERTFTQKLFDRHPHITVEPVPIETIQVPNDSDIIEYRYTAHDIFALRCDDREQSTPISSVLNTAYDLQDGDFMRLSVMAQRVERMKWKSRAAYAWKQMEQKRVPVRARLDAQLFKRQLGDTIRFLTREFGAIFSDVLQAAQNVFIKSDGGSFKDGKKTAGNSYYDRLFPNGWPEESRKKENEPTFTTQIRLAVSSSDRSRRHMIGSGINNALGEINGDNMLLPVKLKTTIRGKAIEEMNSFRTLRKDSDPNIMSCKELGKLHQLPTAEIQTRYEDILQFKRRKESEIPASFRDTSGVYIGNAEVKGETYDVHIPTKDYDQFMMSRVFIGSPRMGKDTAIVNLVVEAAMKGFGSVVLDVVNEPGNLRGMADSLRDALPAERIIDLDASNIDYPFYIGLNEVLEKSENAGNRLANDFSTIFEVEDNGRTRTYLREAIKACDGDLLGVRLLLLSDGSKGDYLYKKIKDLREAGRDYAASFWEGYAEESRGQKSQIRQPIINRLDEIFGDDHLKNMFGQEPNKDIDFGVWLKQGKVILIRVPNTNPNLSELSVKTICQWIVLKTFYTKLMMADKDCCSFLVLNEPHQFLSDGLVKVLGRMLRECPKWRLSMLFAIHDLSAYTIPTELTTALMSSSINWHMFKNTNLSVYKAVSHLLAPQFTPEEAMNQTERFHSINIFFQDGAYKTPFIVKSPEPANKRRSPNDNAFVTLEHSKKYGRVRKQVESEIFAKEEQLFVKKK